MYKIFRILLPVKKILLSESQENVKKILLSESQENVKKKKKRRSQ